MSTVTVNLEQISRSVTKQRVYTRQNWADEWTLRPYLWCNTMTKTVAPEIPTAQLSYHYGKGMQFDSTTCETIEPLDITRHYVRIEIDHHTTDTEATPDTIKWYGVIEDEHNAEEGEAGGVDGVLRRAGVQTFQCLGLEILLQRTRIDHAVCLDFDDEPYTINRSLDFNIVSGKSGIGNLSNELDDDNVHVFTENMTTALKWSTLDIVIYLITHHTPVDKDGTTKIPFDLSASAETIISSFDEPAVQVGNQTLFQLLSQIMDRRRLIGFYLDVVPSEGEPDTVVLNPFRFNETSIEVGDEFIPANSNLRELKFGNALDVQTSIKKYHSEQYDQVEVRGSPIVSCFTVSGDDGTLAQAWQPSLESEYNEAASGEADYPASTEKDARKRRNEDFRKSDKFRSVYRHYVLPESFNGSVGDGEGGDLSYYLHKRDGTGPEPIFYPELRVMPFLPLQAEHDYSGTNIIDDTVTSSRVDGAQIEYRRPLAFVLLQDQGESAPRWYQGDQLAQSVPGGGDGNGRQWSVSVRPLSDLPGVSVDVNGAPQWVIADQQFNPPDNSESLDGYTTIDSSDDMALTISVESFAHAYSRYPLDEDLSSSDGVRRFVIDLGKEAQQHYVAAGTVVGVKNGSLLKVSTAGYVRDDSPRMDRLARLAYAWYGVQRSDLSLDLAQVFTGLNIGDLITTIGDDDTVQTINTPVTQVRYEMRESIGTSPGGVSTHITTGFAQLDARSIA